MRHRLLSPAQARAVRRESDHAPEERQGGVPQTLLKLPLASGNAAVSRLLQREQTTAPRALETSAEAQKLSLEAKRAFDAGNYIQAIALWEQVVPWAGANAPDIQSSLLYHIALAHARAHDIQGAFSAAARYRATPRHDPGKLEQLLEELHSDSEHAQAVPKAETRAEAEKLAQEADQAYASGNYDRASALWRAVADWASSHDPSIEAAVTYDIAMAKARAGDYGGARSAASRYHAMPGREPARDEQLADKIAEIRDENEPPPGVPKVRTKAGAEHVYKQAEAAFAAGSYPEAIALWEAVGEWAAGQSVDVRTDILAAVVYDLAIAKAYAGDAAGARAAVSRYRTLPGAKPDMELALPKKIEKIAAENERAEALVHPKTRDDAKNAALEAEKAYAAGNYDWAISLWEAVLEWAQRQSASVQAELVSAVTYNLAIAKAHAGDFAGAYADAKRYPTLPGAEAARAASLPKRIQELELNK